MTPKHAFKIIFKHAPSEKTMLKSAYRQALHKTHPDHGGDSKSVREIIAAYKQAGILVILDAKRGDIGKTSIAYAEACYNVYKADAVTLSPYMGFDSIGPFQTSGYENGIYVLCRTSNKTAVNFQNQIFP